MKKLICALLIVMTILSLTACSMTIPIAVTSNNVGTKCGVATYKIGSGDCTKADISIDAAAKQAGIKKISHVDFQISFLEGDTFFGLTTLVYGE